MKGRQPWTGPGNDYRGIAEIDPTEALSVAVVAFDVDDPESLLRAIRTQDYPDPVRVLLIDSPTIDDPTVTTVADTDELPAVTKGQDVVVLLSAGELPGPGWLDAHLKWHRRASNVVVIGDSPHDSHSAIKRGSRLFLGNDEGFASFRRSNVSLPRRAWLGCSEIDAQAGWELWNSGHFFVYEPEAATNTEDPAPLETGDPALLADVIPHRRFRSNPSSLYSNPKASWLAIVGSEAEATAAWDLCHSSLFPDVELVLSGPASALSRFEVLAHDNQRVSVVTEGFAAAVRATRGELIALFDARARVPAELLSKVVARFEARPSATVIRAAYRIDEDRYLRIDDLQSVDSALGRDGLPLFAVTTRRELMKDEPRLEADHRAAWARVLERADQSLVISPTVDLTGSVRIPPRTPGVKDIRSAGVREVARVAVREARRRRSEREQEPPEPGRADDRVPVAYVGFTGHNNLGDEAVKTAIERLMPWARFSADATDPTILMVGGGTLINGRRYYLNRMLRQESAVVERVLFGTGVRSPEYWGVTEPMDDWFSFIDASVFAAVRGPDSVKNLKTLGYGRDLPVIGDPALSLEPPADVERVEGRVVVCPVYTSGNLHGGSDDDVFDALATLIGRLRAEGRELVILSAFPQDDRWVIEIMRRAKAPDMPYVPGYSNIDETMRLLASADLVVGERLHAAIMAAAAATPFVGLEYRPKMRDFARSIDQESAILRTDEMPRLGPLCDEILLRRDEVAGSIRSAVAHFRRLQRSAAAELQTRFASKGTL